ncbi:type VII secretion protein EccE [Streptomyces sp. TRM 70351]|uniref:type VII secretion protein EccE n=1 Tax=Streptomyces sp. TRM 70351 TaxID=3116552 RepID=UPI002E7BD14E|nr:type VII secretion protein EccE [Streptomyces sp. TRM 70351]MEE1926739.1 type VII secretion protein EccE [Streptomyces sp. TRM 70351]
MTTTAPRTFGRGRLVAVQTAAACGLAAAAFGGPEGWALGATGGATAVLALLRVKGGWADARFLKRLRRDAFAPPDARPAAADLGLAAALLPALEVGEVTDRNGPAVGVLCDGRGYAAALALPPGVLPALAAGTLADWLAGDPCRPAAVQLLVEQHGPPAWDFHRRFAPTLGYRQLPVVHRPVAVVSHLVLRYEPWDAPEVAQARGGGATGAHTALAAASARLRARLARLDVPARPLDAAALRDLLRRTGDPAGDGRALPDSWAGGHATHCALAARVTGPGAWDRLLTALAGSGAERTVAAATVTRGAEHPRVRTAVRLVSTAAQRCAEARDRLLADGTAQPLTDAQRAGVVATLPLAHPARPLAAATGFTRETEL